MARRHSGLVTQLAERSDSTHLPSGEQYEAVANAFRVGELMDGENERAPVPWRLPADHANDVAGLPEIESVERLVHHQERCGVRRPTASSNRRL